MDVVLCRFDVQEERLRAEAEERTVREKARIMEMQLEMARIQQQQQQTFTGV